MNKARILIVDDQEEILHSLGAILEDEGHEVIRARDGQEALHIVQSDSPDVVFLDIWIPGIDGMQTLRAIKRIDPHCSVIMMSGHGTIETAVKAIKLGAADYLEKPLNLEDVLHLVHKAVAGRTQRARSAEANNGTPGRPIGNSPKAIGLRRALENAASETGTVWLSGEKGTGKEFLARILHQSEGKDKHSLVKIRCTDLTETNMDEVLLGKEHGPGRGRQGKFRQAADGTLLLIRVDRLQKGLRSRLEELIVGHFGGKTGPDRQSPPPFRIVSTSITDPETLVAEDDFPRALADFLGRRIIHLPTLRERPEDIPLFIDHFLREAAKEFDRNISGTDEEATARLLSYSWPGNVKELKILIEHVVMTAPGALITLNDLLIPGEKETPRDPARDSTETASRSEAKRIRNAGESPGKVVHGSQAGDIETIEPDSPVRRQRTLRGKVVMYGQGLHSGTKTGLTLSPLPPSSGIVFGHITSQGTVPALLNFVESTDFCTSLRNNGTLARTIEHLMAVFHVYGLTNLLVKISGEVPIMDGSALEFCRLIESGEIIPQEDSVAEIRITEPLELPLDPAGPKRMRIEPADCLEVEYFLDYPPPVGKMHMAFRCTSPEDFRDQIAPARTFGFVKDMRMMDEMGLAGGGRLSNLVLLDEEKVVNPPLRFPDEFVRHKILDIIGDFYLLGRPFVGRIVARQTGHSDNVAMLKLINEKFGIL